MTASRPVADGRQMQIRMQKGDDLPLQPNAGSVPPLRMPSPAEFGLASAPTTKANGIDWIDVRGRMTQLNIGEYHLDATTIGFRFSCVVPTTDGPRRIIGEAATESEAIQQVLARAELLR